ncbi:DoxX family membrane protein [Flavilitoribacter nigricans]|uniref:DoxX family protein n=1 Tax=Flavilitoribacter nigricans (strain ATCC 23147 / DSM 23189 / NBRC 102662 / NCIMB 1420 / SS-2) TaxID=1122177 RepID=A0A2D0N2W4_FLAN2|nr:DoxX family membrane protein [Flavilitoribacter nigricans]PHN02479.1 DoxX family protein [Flavilitoribacter nigricans DSM 23189 = NBRC 102662]
MDHKTSAYALARLPMGFSFFGHGLVRIPKLATFAQGMADSFQGTLLPEGFVLAFAYILPIIELILGIMLLLGIAMRQSAVAGVFLICILIFGSSLQENWSAVATQLFYGLYFAILYLFAEHNGYALMTARRN